MLGPLNVFVSNFVVFYFFLRIEISDREEFTVFGSGRFHLDIS